MKRREKKDENRELGKENIEKRGGGGVVDMR